MWRRYTTLLFRSRYRRHVNICNRLAEKAKSELLSNKINQAKGNPKKLWGEVNKMLHKTKDCTLPSLTSMVACENFLQFFIEKIDKNREQFSNAPASPVSSVQPVPAERSFCEFLPVSGDETRKVINAAPCKSCMLDPWPTFLVRECLDIVTTTQHTLDIFKWGLLHKPQKHKKSLTQ
jgi:hypothetical protein